MRTYSVMWTSDAVGTRTDRVIVTPDYFTDESDIPKMLSIRYGIPEDKIQIILMTLLEES